MRLSTPLNWWVTCEWADPPAGGPAVPALTVAFALADGAAAAPLPDDVADRWAASGANTRGP